MINVEVKKNIDEENGKAKCFVCMNDYIDTNTCDGNDYQEIFKNTRSAYLNPSNLRKKSKLLSMPDNNTNPNQYLMIKNTTNLINPCKCNKTAHRECLTNYCFINISFKCLNCKENYIIKFQENKTQDANQIYLLLIILLTLIQVLIIVVGILLIANIIVFNDKIMFWRFILGFLLIFFGLVFFWKLTQEINDLISIKEKSPIFMNYSDSTNDNLFDKNKGNDYNDFLTRRHNCNVLNLIEKKLSNLIFNETTIQEEMKITKFIEENNNIYHIHHYTTQKLEGNEMNNDKITSYIIDKEEKLKLLSPESKMEKNKKSEDLIIIPKISRQNSKNEDLIVLPKISQKSIKNNDDEEAKVKNISKMPTINSKEEVKNEDNKKSFALNSLKYSNNNKTSNALYYKSPLKEIKEEKDYLRLSINDNLNKKKMRATNIIKEDILKKENVNVLKKKNSDNTLKSLRNDI